MDFMEAMGYLKRGMSVTRKSWDDMWYIRLGECGDINYYSVTTEKQVDLPNMFGIDDIYADDWYMSTIGCGEVVPANEEA